MLLVGATVQLVRTRTSEQFTHYTSTNSVVHYSLDHPADWRRVEDVSSAVVFSPRVQAISTLFFGNGAGTSWTGARQLLRAGAADAVGLYVYSQESDLKGTPPAQFRQSVTDLSPLTTTITSSTETTVSGAVSDQIEAVIADPGDPSVRLGRTSMSASRLQVGWWCSPSSQPPTSWTARNPSSPGCSAP